MLQKRKMNLLNSLIICGLMSISKCAIVHLSREAQVAGVQESRTACYRQIVIHEQTGRNCNGVWDGIMCWPETTAGTMARLPCPSYINGFDTDEFASRWCLSNGTWAAHPSYEHTRDKGWTNYTACIPPQKLY